MMGMEVGAGNVEAITARTLKHTNEFAYLWDKTIRI